MTAAQLVDALVGAALEDPLKAVATVSVVAATSFVVIRVLLASRQAARACHPQLLPFLDTPTPFDLAPSDLGNASELQRDLHRSLAARPCPVNLASPVASHFPLHVLGEPGAASLGPALVDHIVAQHMAPCGARACDRHSIASRLAAWMGAGVFAGLAIRHGFPMQMFQPKWVVCVCPEPHQNVAKLQVLFVAFVGTPVLGDRPGNKHTPTLLVAMTRDLNASDAEAVCSRVAVRQTTAKSTEQWLAAERPALVRACEMGRLEDWLDVLCGRALE